MAEEQELKIVITQDTVDLVQGLAKAGDALKDFGADGQFSLTELTKAFNLLKKEFSDIKDPLERARFAESAQKVKTGIDILNTIFKGLGDNARNSKKPVEDLGKAIDDVAASGTNIESLRAKIDALTKAAFKQSDINNVRDFGEQIRATEAELLKYMNALKGVSDSASNSRKPIVDLTKDLNSLGDQEKNIIALTERLKALKAASAGTTDVTQIRAYGVAYRETEKEITRLQNAFNGFSDSVARTKKPLIDLDNEFDKLGKNAPSIIFLEARLRALKDAANATGDVNALRSLGEQMRGVQTQIANANEVINGTTNATRRSRIAVYGLNQVVRDLPFGFIAISNNIPVLIDQLAELRRETGSNRAAFKAFISGLAGFGGISIAISAAISVITYAVQKYGSLSNAIKELTGNIVAAEIVQNSYNKAVTEGAGEVAKQTSKLDLLASLSSDATIGINNQKYATKLLVEEVDKLIVSQDLQKQGIEAVTGELLDYARNVVIARANLRGFGVVIDELGVRFAQAQLDGVTFTDYLVGAVKKIFAFTNAVKEGNFAFAQQVLELDYVQVAQQRYENRLNEIRKAQEKAQKASLEYIKTEIKNGLALEDILGEKLTEEEKRAKILAAEALKRDQIRKKEARDAAAAAAQEAKDTLAVLKTQLDAQKAYVDTLSLLDANYIQEKLQVLELEAKIKKLNISSEIKDKEKLNNALWNLEMELSDARIALIQKTKSDIKKIRDQEAKDIEEQNNKELNYINQLTEQYNKIDFGGVTKRINEFYKSIKTGNKLSDDQLKVLGNTIQNVVSSSIDTLFNALERGDNIFEALADSLKQLVIQLAATIVKALILRAIVQAIPGLGQFVTVAGAASNILQLLGSSVGGMRVAAPTGGNTPLINGPGGLALSGQVVFVQRGNDLVGVLGRTNARIGRIG